MNFDSTLEAIMHAVAAGREGDVAGARERLLGLWSEIGVTGDPLHRCTLAHYLADLYDDPARALTWDVRALDAADAVTPTHPAAPDIAGFYPSLHLNLADAYRRLGSFETAEAHLATAWEHSPDQHEGAYGDLLRTAFAAVTEALSTRDTAPIVANIDG